MFSFIILLLGFTHGFYLSFALYKSNNKENNANIILAFVISTFSAILLLIFCDELQLMRQVPWLINVDKPLVFLLAPLLYTYVQRLTSPYFVKINYLHFVPFILACLTVIPFLFESNEFKVRFLYDYENYDARIDQYADIYENYFQYIAMPQLFIYLSLIFVKLKRYSNLIQANFSFIEKINLKWLFTLNTALMMLLILWCVDESINYYAVRCIDHGIGSLCDISWMSEERDLYFAEIGIVVCIYLISFYGIKQPEIFHLQAKKTNTTEVSQSDENIELTVDILDESNEKYQKSSLDEQLSYSVFEELKSYLFSSKLHLEPELSLGQLSSETGLSKHHLSQAINQCAQQNFFDFINGLRVEQAKILLADEQKMNVLEVSLAAGFNSRSAFYNAFKKYTQMTPTQYRKQQVLA